MGDRREATVDSPQRGGELGGVGESPQSNSPVTGTVGLSKSHHHGAEQHSPADRAGEYRIVVDAVCVKERREFVVGEGEESSGKIGRWVAGTEVTEVDGADELLLAKDQVARMDVAVQPRGRRAPRRRRVGPFEQRPRVRGVDLASKLLKTRLEVARTFGE